MGAQVATLAWAHCTVVEATMAGELSGRWQAAGYMVAEHATTRGEVRMYVTALAKGATQTIDPKLAGAAVQLGIVVAELATKRTFRARRMAGSNTAPLAGERGQPVWSTEPLQALGIELHVRDDDDAFGQLDVLAVGLGMPRAKVSIKPRTGWLGYGDPRLDSRRHPPTQQ
jgi:hypothetical protein